MTTSLHPLHISILTSPAALRAPGPRAIVTLAEAEVIKARFNQQLAANPEADITTIDLSGRTWPLETLGVLRSILEKVRGTVITLKLDDVIISLPTEQGFATLCFFAEVFHRDHAPLIENIFLSFNALDNRFLDEMYENNCRDLINHPNLKRLDLRNTGVSIAFARDLTMLLGDTCSQLLELRLGRNQLLYLEGAQIIGALLARCTSLQQLDYEGSHKLSEGTAALANGLRVMAEARGEGGTALTELNLRKSNFGDGSQEDHPVHILCAVLRNSPNLKWLRLWGCDLDGDGLQLVVDALIESQAKLEILDVGCSFLGDEARDVLIDFIRDHQTETLAELYAEDNILEDEGVQALLEVLADCPNLRCLELTSNDMEEESYVKLSETNFPFLQKLWVQGDSTDDLDEDLVAEIRGLCPQVIITSDDADYEDLRNPNYAISVDSVARWVDDAGAVADTDTDSSTAEDNGGIGAYWIYNHQDRQDRSQFSMLLMREPAILQFQDGQLCTETTMGDDIFVTSYVGYVYCFEVSALFVFLNGTYYERHIT